MILYCVLWNGQLVAVYACLATATDCAAAHDAIPTPRALSTSLETNVVVEGVDWKDSTIHSRGAAISSTRVIFRFLILNRLNDV